MPHTVTDVIFNLKQQMERFAASKNHTHNEYLKTDGDYAPKAHSSSSADYGIGNPTEYGHVKQSQEVSNSPDSVPSNNAVTTFVNNCINTLRTEIINRFEGEDGKINDAISKYDFTSQLKRYSIAATYQKPNNYATKFTSLEEAIAQKAQDDELLDVYTWAGHYQIMESDVDPNNFKIQYGQSFKYYINGLLDVRKSGNIIIQELYTTTKDSNNTYILSGEKYTRTGTLNNNTIIWNPWIAAYIPYSQSEITIGNLDTGINNIVLKETTAGYLIEWENQGSYEIQEQSGQPRLIGEFSKPLNINDTVHTFSNHVGGYQIDITKNNIKMISNKQLGAAIDNDYLNQTYFIPRIG